MVAFLLLALQTPIVEMPSESWSGYFYGSVKERQTILGRANLSGYADLRKHLLPKGDEEVRIWMGFGITYLQGMILRKKAEKWSATRLLSALPNRPKSRWAKAYVAPKSGWATFLTKAETLGLWTLPDDSTLPQKDRKEVMDGFSYVVEIQREGKYRAYQYDNPEYQTQWPESKRILAIGKLLEQEFPHPDA